MGRLKVEPEVGLCAEVAGQLGGGIRSDGTALVDNISYAGCRHAESDGKRMGRDVHGASRILSAGFPPDVCGRAYGFPTSDGQDGQIDGAAHGLGIAGNGLDGNVLAGFHPGHGGL